MNPKFKANVEILQQLVKLIYKYPELRFSQLLCNFDFITQDELNGQPVWTDEYYLEPEKLLERVNLAISEVEEETTKDS